MRGALARRSSAASGFFFWGMIDEPLVHASGSSTKPNSCERPQHELGPEARQVRRAGRRGAQVVQDEVAVGDRVDRVGRDALEAELGRHGAAIGGEVDPRQRPGAERQRRRLLGGEAQPRAVALEHPHVGEQVVAEVDRLGALQVRVARQRPVEVALGGVDERRHERRRRRRRPPVRASRVKSATSVATWSLRERAVCSRPPTGPASSVSRRSTAMWMSSSSGANGKRPSRSSASTASRPASSASRSSSDSTPCAASMRACARDCATSWGHRRRSKPIDALRAWKAGSWGSRKRDTQAAQLTQRSGHRRSGPPGWRARSRAGTA